MEIPFHIEPATEQDIDSVLACLQQAFEPYRHLYPPEGFLDTTLSPRTAHERLRDYTVLVARDHAGDVVGTIAFQVRGSDCGHLRGMAVLPRFLGTGVAESLLESAESELVTMGCRRITLDTTAPLQRAIRFYEKHRYRPTGTVGDFYGMPLYEYDKRVHEE